MAMRCLGQPTINLEAPVNTHPTEPNTTPDLLLSNAQQLTERYLQARKTFRFARTLEECLKNERQKIEELYVAYLPYLDMAGIKFLRGKYFLENENFIRFQELPEKYLTSDLRDYYFISHRWLSPEHPDPNGDQFALLSGYLQNLKPEALQTWGFWYDYSCIPQRDAYGQRSAEEERQFQAALKVMHLLPMLSSNIVLFDTPYLNRAWCFMEWVCATKISPVLAEEDSIVPLFNNIKFRHMALIVLFLIKDDNFRAGFIGGDNKVEVLALAHLNRLISKSLASCVSTIENDKHLIVSMLYEHFGNHLRLLGLRTQLMTAWRLLERVDEPTVEEIFAQFLIISEDPAMEWTNEATFVIESVLNGLGNPTDMIFHRGEITTTSNSSIRKGEEVNEPYEGPGWKRN
jgi:hypothetical protein